MCVTPACVAFHLLSPTALAGLPLRHAGANCQVSVPKNWLALPCRPPTKNSSEPPPRVTAARRSADIPRRADHLVTPSRSHHHQHQYCHRYRYRYHHHQTLTGAVASPALLLLQLSPFLFNTISRLQPAGPQPELDIVIGIVIGIDSQPTPLSQLT